MFEDPFFTAKSGINVIPHFAEVGIRTRTATHTINGRGGPLVGQKAGGIEISFVLHKKFRHGPDLRRRRIRQPVEMGSVGEIGSHDPPLQFQTIGSRIEIIFSRFTTVVVIDPERALGIGINGQRTGEDAFVNDAAGFGINAALLAETRKNFSGIRINHRNLIGHLAAIYIERVAKREMCVRPQRRRPYAPRIGELGCLGVIISGLPKVLSERFQAMRTKEMRHFGEST